MGVDVNEGAAQIAQLLQPEQPSDSAPEPETAEQPETVEEEAVEPEIETGDEVEEVETPQAEDAEELPEAESDTEPAETKYTVKVNGEEVEVGLDDLRKGYMMETDYRRKTSEVARAREEVKAKEDALNAKIVDAEMMLNIELEDLNSEANKELKEYDPTAFYEKKEAVEAKKARIEKLKSDQAQAEAQRKVESINKEKELLLNALPEWLDENTLNAEAPLLNQQWQDLGFKDAELDLFGDHRLILLTRKAALYDKLKSAKPETKKVTPKPKAAKPGTPKSKEQIAKARKSEKAAKLKKTGNVKDAAAAFAEMFQ